MKQVKQEWIQTIGNVGNGELTMQMHAYDREAVVLVRIVYVLLIQEWYSVLVQVRG